MKEKRADHVHSLVTRQKTIVIVRTKDSDSAFAASKAVMKAGLRLIDIPVTVPKAMDVVAELSKDSGCVIGVGSVTAMHEAVDAIKAGASFIICPNTDRTIIDYCQDNGIFVAAGGMTPTEIMEAHLAGVDLVAVYPIDLIGGPRYTRSLLRPMPFLNLLPVGGIGSEEAQEHLREGAAGVGITDAILDPADIANGDMTAIEERARAFFEAVCSTHAGEKHG